MYIDSLIHTAMPFYTHLTNRGVQEILHRLKAAEENLNKVCLILDDKISGSEISASEDLKGFLACR